MANRIEENTEQELKQLVENWVKAELQGDGATLAGILDEDFVGIGPRGFVLTKPEWVNRYNSGDLKNEAYSFEVARIRTYGGTALITGQHNQTTFYKGQAVPGEFRSTLALVKQPDGWKLANLQLSPIMEPIRPPQTGR